MKKLRMTAVFCIVAVLLGSVGAYAATNYGTESDPLITLSYLNEVLKPELQQSFWLRRALIMTFIWRSSKMLLNFRFCHSSALIIAQNKAKHITLTL